MTTGKAVLALARRHVGESYVFGAFAPKDNAQWRGPWDCAEFASWCVYQAARILYGCHDNHVHPARADAYTGHWARDAEALGQKIPIDETAVTPGAAVLRVPLQGLIGHIAFSDGAGGTVEAHSSKLGVIKSKISGRRWDFGVLIPGISYAKSPRVVRLREPKIVYRLTQPPMTGEVVRQIQERLKKKGFDPGPIDGVFGSKTFAAVRAFQLVKGLLPDGEVGPATAKALGIALG